MTGEIVESRIKTRFRLDVLASVWRLNGVSGRQKSTALGYARAAHTPKNIDLAISSRLRAYMAPKPKAVATDIGNAET
jgi:hypothetical protein